MPDMASLATTLIFAAIVAIHSVSCFMPTQTTDLQTDAPYTSTHEDVTSKAIVNVAKLFMAENPADYPNPDETLIETSFQEARRQFTVSAAEPDFSDEQFAPEAHFDGEQFDASQSRLLSYLRNIRQYIRKADMTNARTFTGNALHTLQDFYSHSNWIEMGNTATHPEIGIEGAAVTGTAAPDERTCTDCTDPGGSLPLQCNDNSEIIDAQNKLTSGYTSSQDSPSWDFKTIGKCSHGGDYDSTAVHSPIGGISKDTTSSTLSPHNSLHGSAAKLAITASVDFLNRIRDNPDDPVTDGQFAEFIGLTLGTTLCFVIDTTGSMSDEIDAVKETTIGIVDSSSSSAGGQKPSDYVLVPFNDPTYGPANKTEDPAEMIRWLSALTATGGGDTPELCMNGLILAIDAVRPGSTCTVYTDAPAKDSNLFPVVKANALEKNVKITFFYTIAGLTRRQRRSVPRSPYAYYDELASVTGGAMLMVKKSDIGPASDTIIGMGIKKLQVTVFIADNILGAFTFPMDATLSNVTLQLSVGTGTITSVIIRTPTGVTYTGYTTMLGLTNLKVYDLGSDLEPGIWTVTVSSGSYVYSAVVTATSEVSYYHQFARQRVSGHGGYEVISGIPVAGADCVVIADIFGAVDPSTLNSTNLISNVTSLHFLSPTGAILATSPLQALNDFQKYVTQTQIPSGSFRVAIEGTDKNGNTFRRVESSLFLPAQTRIIVAIDGNGTFTINPGDSVNVAVNVTSAGAAATWYIRVSDTGNYYTGSSPLTVFLNPGQSQLLMMNFRAPTSASFGYVSIVTITAGGSSVTSVDNYYVFYITISAPPDDRTVPDLTITSQSFPCTGSGLPCEQLTWNARFTAQDAGSGLRTITAQTVSRNYTMSLSGFVEGTIAPVTGIYTSTCCYSTATLRAVDGMSNVATKPIGK